MFELVTIFGAIIGAFVAIRTLLKGPHITFLLDRAKIILDDGEDEENVSLLFALVNNKKKLFFSDVARKVTVCVLYRSPVDNNEIGLNASAGLPWLKSSGTCIEVLRKLKSQKDILKALERHLFERKETDLPQGRGRGLAVAYGIESSNKLYLASNPPIEIPLPSPKRAHFSERYQTLTVCFLRLEIAGENLPSTLSEGTMILGDAWNNWTIPSTVETLRTPSKLRNMLLRIGVGRKTKVIEVKPHTDLEKS